MKIISKSEFYDIINDVTFELYEDLYVLFRNYYTRKEAEQAHFEDLNLEYLEYDGNHDFHVWLHDWDEGEEYIVFEGIYTEEQLIEFIMKGSERNVQHNL